MGVCVSKKAKEGAAGSGKSFREEYGGEVAESVKELPEWIRLGCSDKEYICEEKKIHEKSKVCGFLFGGFC